MVEPYIVITCDSIDTAAAKSTDSCSKKGVRIEGGRE